MDPPINFYRLINDTLRESILYHEAPLLTETLPDDMSTRNRAQCLHNLMLDGKVCRIGFLRN